MAAKKKRVVAKKVKVTRKKKQGYILQIAVAFIIIDVVALVAYIYSSLH